MIKYSGILSMFEKTLEFQSNSIAVVDDEKDVIFLFTTILQEIVIMSWGLQILLWLLIILVGSVKLTIIL